MEFNIIQDYFSDTMPPSVTYAEKGVYLYKDITPIYSLNNPEEIVSYQCLRQCVRQEFESREVVEGNFDLIWKAYGECGYDGNILTDSIETVMNFWQNKNLDDFNQFLKENPLLYIDGNYYGVEEIDRNEMSQQFLSYQVKEKAGLNPTSIQWHNKKKACKKFTLEDFLTLTLAIEQYTLPYYNLMQSRKEAIFNCTDKIDVFKIPITYKVSENTKGESVDEETSI